jgi:Ni,Fe-hydrogenase maturation factor
MNYKMLVNRHVMLITCGNIVFSEAGCGANIVEYQLYNQLL